MPSLSQKNIHISINFQRLLILKRIITYKGLLYILIIFLFKVSWLLSWLIEIRRFQARPLKSCTNLEGAKQLTLVHEKKINK